MVPEPVELPRGLCGARVADGAVIRAVTPRPRSRGHGLRGRAQRNAIPGAQPQFGQEARSCNKAACSCRGALHPGVSPVKWSLTGEMMLGTGAASPAVLWSRCSPGGLAGRVFLTQVFKEL